MRLPYAGEPHRPSGTAKVVARRMRLSALLLALAVAAVGAAVFAGVPHTFATGETLLAADLNNGLSALDQRIAALEAVTTPPGTIVAYGGPSQMTADGGAPTLPVGWLLCDGSPVSRTTFAALFAAIGINFGGGDGLATFNLSDLRGRFPRGTDHAIGRDPDAASRTASNAGGHTGDVVGSIEGDTFTSHGHTVNDPGHAHNLGSQTWGLASLGASGALAFGTNSNVANNPPTARPPRASLLERPAEQRHAPRTSTSTSSSSTDATRSESPIPRSSTGRKS